MRGSCCTCNLSGAGAAGVTAAPAASRCCHRRDRYPCLRAVAVDRCILPLPLSTAAYYCCRYSCCPFPRYRYSRHRRVIPSPATAAAISITATAAAAAATLNHSGTYGFCAPVKRVSRGLSEPVIGGGAEFERCRYFCDYPNGCYFQLCCFPLRHCWCRLVQRVWIEMFIMFSIRHSDSSNYALLLLLFFSLIPVLFIPIPIHLQFF